MQESAGGSPACNLNDEAWIPLSRFIDQLPDLQDLVWIYGNYMPPSVLSSVSAKGCRLHMHHFRLNSLIQLRDSPQSIEPEDYALATSPSPFSIVAQVRDFATEVMLNYNEEAVMRMLAGTAPNLAHICLVPTRAGGSLGMRETYRLGKPAWSGFLPSAIIEIEAKQKLIHGNLHSLVLVHGKSYSIDKWARLTDFTRLRCFIMPWSLENSVSLAELATRGNFKSLDTLGLSRIEDETDQGQESLTRLLQGAGRLRRLAVDGYISNETFDIILRCHGGSLRKFLMLPYRDYESKNPLVLFSEAVVQRMVENRPNLEQIWLTINLKRGDAKEKGIYHALGRLPRLKRAFLKLQYSVGLDEELWNEELWNEELWNEELWNEEEDGKHPLMSIHESNEIPFVHLREAFSNSAIDATLALFIFNLISSGGSLSYLRLEPSRKIVTPSSPENGESQFGDMLRWFNRSWVCKRDVGDRVRVEELDAERTALAREEWRCHFDDEEKWAEDELFRKVFEDIWPPKTSEWWHGWESLPLSEGPA